MKSLAINLILLALAFGWPTASAAQNRRVDTPKSILIRNVTLIDGVSKVELWGDQGEVIYIDVAESQVSQMGISNETLELTLRNQNVVNDAGSVDLQNQRIRFAPSGEFQSTEDIANLIVRASALDSLQGSARTDSSELIRVRDIA